MTHAERVRENLVTQGMDTLIAVDLVEDRQKWINLVELVHTYL